MDTLLPSREDINVYDSLDEQRACDHFLGKSLEDAMRNLADRSATCEDLMWMGIRAFCFYVTAAVKYIQSDLSTGDFDFVPEFATLLEFRIEKERNELGASSSQLLSACDSILTDWTKFDLCGIEEAERQLYGQRSRGLKERYLALKESLMRLEGEKDNV